MADLEKSRLSFLPGVAEKLGHYVYALRDPRDHVVFYVGKGKGSRAYQHARHAKPGGSSLLNPKVSRINDIHEAGREVIVESFAISSLIRQQRPRSKQRSSTPSQTAPRATFTTSSPVMDGTSGVGFSRIAEEVRGQAS